MKRLLAFVLLTSTAHADLINVPFSAVVTNFIGAPFGIHPEVGVTTVYGSFSYDSATPSAGTLCTNCQDFLAMPPSSFVLHIAGVTINSSDFVLRSGNNVLNFGGSDIFRADATSAGLNSMGSEFLVNGLQGDGAAVVQLIDTDQLLYATDAAAHVVPTQAQLQHSDFVVGHLADDLAPGGQSANVIVFRSIPEPSTLLLAVIAFPYRCVSRPGNGRRPLTPRVLGCHPSKQHAFS